MKIQRLNYHHHYYHQHPQKEKKRFTGVKAAKDQKQSHERKRPDQGPGGAGNALRKWRQMMRPHGGSRLGEQDEQRRETDEEAEEDGTVVEKVGG